VPPTAVQPVRGQNVPELHACGMQKVAVVLHVPLGPHVAPPLQSLAALQVHWLVLTSQLPVLHWLLEVQLPATAQLPPCGG
jgi:hypothetical protein